MSAFASRFSATQRAALHALGHGLLECTPFQRGSSGGGARLPASIVIDTGPGEPALLRAVLAAARACTGGGDDPRVVQAAGTLRLAIGGEGEEWRLSLAQLGASPGYKAALWRALRALRAPAAGAQHARGGTR